MIRYRRSIGGLAAAWGVAALIGCVGCSDAETPPQSTTPPPVMNAVGDTTVRRTPTEVRQELRANEMASFQTTGGEITRAELFRSGIRSIEALRGLPLQSIDLGMTDVSDLSPLEGMPLQEVVLEDTPVSDISPLKGMRLSVLKLQNTQVVELSPIEGMPLKQLNLMGLPVDSLAALHDMPLETLWIPKTRVTDLSALAEINLVSLDIEDTQISDLSPLRGMSNLKRLNIARTPVTDLTPLSQLSLERITLTPSRITTGIEVLRGMPSLTHIQTSMEMPTTAEEFWKRFDLRLFEELPADSPAPDDPGRSP